MKKLLLVGLLSSASLGAQVNAYFINNPTWVCFHEADPWPCVLEDSLNYYLNGDSIINAMTYKVLYTKGHFREFSQGPPTCPNQNYTYQDTVPTGYLRSQGMQMYFIPEGDSVEHLLYDFNLTVGSHLPLTYINTDTSYVVTTIDSIYTAAGYRQRYFLNGNNWEYLIEGVGSSAGLMYPTGLLFEQYASLICYSQDDTAWFPSQGPSCSVMTANHEAITTLPVSFYLYPNPATGLLNVQAPVKAGVIQITDALGNLILENSFSEKCSIDVDGYASGLYLVHVYQDSESYTSHFVIE